MAKKEEESEEDRGKKTRVRVGCGISTVILVLFCLLFFGGCVSNCRKAEEEAIRLAPVPYLYTDTKVAQGERQKRRLAQLLEVDGRLIKFKIDLTNLHHDVRDLVWEKDMVCEYHIESSSQGEYSGHWFQYESNSKDGLPTYQGKFTVRKTGDRDYYGKCTWEDGEFIKEFSLKPRVERQF